MAEAHGGEGPPAPLTERGARTRERLVTAAREVFEERGFLETRVAHIAQHARVAYGSFYTYFPSKEAVFLEVADRLFEVMTQHPLVPARDRSPPPASAAPTAPTTSRTCATRR
jgi:Transcriptional regulator